MILFMLFILFVITSIIVVPLGIIGAIYKGKAVSAKQLNVYKKKAVYEVHYKRGKPLVLTVKLGSPKYNELEQLANEQPTT